MSHMQQISIVVQRLHALSLTAFAEQRDALIRDLNVPLAHWRAEPLCSLLGGTADSESVQAAAPVAKQILARWRQISLRCESEIEAAVSRTLFSARTAKLCTKCADIPARVALLPCSQQEHQLHVLDQVLAFCASSATPHACQGAHYVHLPVGLFGWQDEKVRISWEQLLDTDEQGEPLLAVDFACVGPQPVELHCLWLTMHCPYSNQLVSSTHPIVPAALA